MSVLTFKVTEQLLENEQAPYVVANSVDFLQAEFDFSECWDETIKTAVFKSASGGAYAVSLDDNNLCTVPWEVIQCPSFTVSVYGTNGTKRITTNQVVVKVEICGFIGGEPSKDPTPTIYDELANDISEIKDNLGTAAALDVGTNEGNIPVLNENGQLAPSTETDPTVPAWAKEKTKPTYTYSEIQDTPGLEDLTGVLPITNGGTGASSLTDAQKNLQWYRSLSQLNLSNGCSTHDIIEALPNFSIYSSSVNNVSQLSDAPAEWGQLTIIKSNVRKIILFNQSLSIGNNSNNFYFGEHRNNAVTWYKIFTSNPNCAVPIANGGTGASTASEALKKLGGVPTSRTINSKALSENIELSALDIGAATSSDVGDISTLLTADKTVVGAINELYSTIGDLNSNLETVLEGGSV